MSYKGSWSRVKDTKHFKSEYERIFKKQKISVHNEQSKGDDLPSNKTNKTKQK